MFQSKAMYFVIVYFVIQINPNYLEDRNDSIELVQNNAKNLIAVLTEAVNDIFMSTDSCPK